MSPNQYVSDLRAERDALRAKVARVEELAAFLARPLLSEREGTRPVSESSLAFRDAAQMIRMALGYTESDPAVTTRQATAQGAGDGV